MGCTNSIPSTLNFKDGNGQDFLDHYTLEKQIGEGEFGVVKIVRETKGNQNNRDRACKILRKGRQFKNNVLYAPIKPEVLRNECKILSTLAGKHYSLHLHALYESPSVIYIVTELCCGGEMMQYVNDYYGDTGLLVEDVSRISFQLIDAVNHCAKHGVIHRDIKPENIMFQDAERGSELRLIDFGSGVIDSSSPDDKDDEEKPEVVTTKQADGTELLKHTTFAGTAFYISPEMFQKNYTSKTDIWSVGVTLYVLVAGYPVHALQEAFNGLQISKAADQRSQELRALPNMPQDMPDSYYEMLEMCLTRKSTRREEAGVILGCPFLKVHGKQNQDLSKTMLIAGTKDRHAYFFQYEKYERAVTSLLAAMLRKEQLQQLMSAIDGFIDSHDTTLDQEKNTPAYFEAHANNKKLQIIKIAELRTILSQLKFYEVVSKMDNIPSDGSYEQNAYHIALLRQFITYEDATELVNTTKDDDLDTEMDASLGDSNNSMGQKWRKVKSMGSKFSLNMSVRSTERTLREEDVLNHSVSGGNGIWNQKKKAVQGKKTSKAGIGNSSMGRATGKGGMRRNFSVPVLNDLDRSVHAPAQIN